MTGAGRYVIVSRNAMLGDARIAGRRDSLADAIALADALAPATARSFASATVHDRDASAPVLHRAAGAQ